MYIDKKRIEVVVNNDYNKVPDDIIYGFANRLETILQQRIPMTERLRHIECLIEGVYGEEFIEKDGFEDVPILGYGFKVQIKFKDHNLVFFRRGSEGYNYKFIGDQQ